MIFSRAQAIVIMQIINQTTEYYAGTGTKCLLCGQERACTEHTDNPDLIGMTRQRHHKCRCGHSFKSIEKLEKQAETPEIIPKPAKNKRKR